MTKTSPCCVKIISALLLLLSLSSTPELALAFAPQENSSSQEASATQSANPVSSPATKDSDVTTSSAAVSELPDSPGSVQAPAADPSQATGTQQSQTASPPASQQKPVGTAAAEASSVQGTGASKPAGVAIAPGKQHQVRSFLIKLGAVVGAGAAVGTVMALSMGTSSKPPGAK
jgi:cytoskeletal protein RodZ